MVKKTISRDREERLAKLMDKKSGKYFIVTLDDGLTLGPINGLSNIKDTIKRITKGGASAVVLNKGIIHNVYRRQKRELGVIMNLSGSTTLSPDPNHKVIVGTVKEAMSLATFAVSIQVNIGPNTEADMLHDLGKISTECNLHKIPILAIMRAAGPMIDDPYDVDLVKHVARVGAELGADLVAVSYTGNVDTFSEIVASCPVPVLARPTAQIPLDLEILNFVKDVVSAGADGVAIGRNIYKNKNIQGITYAIAKFLREKGEVEAVYKDLMENRL